MSVITNSQLKLYIIHAYCREGNEWTMIKILSGYWISLLLFFFFNSKIKLIDTRKTIAGVCCTVALNQLYVLYYIQICLVMHTMI